MSIFYDIRSGTLVKSKLYNNGLSLKEVINSNTATPSLSSVIDYLLNGGGESAIEYAMLELADGALDWVLDPANNSVKYTTVGEVDSSHMCTSDGATYTAKFICDSNGGHAVGYTPSGRLTCGGTLMSWQCGSDSYPIPIENYIPIDVVAAKVISNADDGHAPSQEAVNNSVKI